MPCRANLDHILTTCYQNGLKSGTCLACDLVVCCCAQQCTVEQCYCRHCYNNHCCPAPSPQTSPSVSPPRPPVCDTGNLAAIRAFIKNISRLVYDLSTNKGNAAAGCSSATSLAPAGVRCMFNYVLKDSNTCKKATELQSKIVTDGGSGEEGCLWRLR